MTSGHAPAIELRELSKRFGGVLANDRVNLQVQAAAIHGLIGENGAGKSTAMKMAFGLYRPDSGQILIDGQPREWGSPADAIAAGIGMVHQHFMLAGPYSALDNILLGAEPTRRGLIDRPAARTKLEALARQYELPVPWDQPVEELPVGIQQRVEILKLLFRDARILIMDEPTAVLTPQETIALFRNLKKLQAEGKTILLVTHKLREVMAITDRVTVMRGGRVTGDFETAQTNPDELARAMVGRQVSLRVDAGSATPRSESALEVAGLSLPSHAGGRHRLVDVSFQVRRGEIVGIAGVEGNGQSELLQAILHPSEHECRAHGTITVLGQNVTSWPASRIRDLGVAVVPEDRLHEGLLPDRPVMENFLLGLHRNIRFRTRGFLRRSKLARVATNAIHKFDVRPPNLRLPAGHLSGGNQQKLIFAREFERQPQLVIAAQPTRGVDVGAIEFIHRRIIAARDAGAGVLLISSELDEILSLASRILVLYEGRITADLQPGPGIEEELGRKMGGA